MCLSFYSAFQAWANVWIWLGCYICPLVCRYEFKLQTAKAEQAGQPLVLVSSQERAFSAVGLPDHVFIAPLELWELQGQVILLNISCNRRGKLHFRIKVSDQHSVPREEEQGGRAGKTGYNPIFSSSLMKVFLVSPLPHFYFLCHYFVKSLSDERPWFKSLLSKIFENSCGVFIFFNIEF